MKSLEEYLRKKSKEWNIINQTGYYPDEPDIEYDRNESHKLIIQDFVNDKICLPRYGKVTIREGYWKRLHDSGL